jgi:hypothetical protein
MDVSFCAALPALRAVCKTRWSNSWIDPKPSAGQYQHDVNQSDLARSLDTVVEDCEQCRRGPQHGQRAVGAGVGRHKPWPSRW